MRGVGVREKGVKGAGDEGDGVGVRGSGVKGLRGEGGRWAGDEGGWEGRGQRCEGAEGGGGQGGREFKFKIEFVCLSKLVHSLQVSVYIDFNIYQFLCNLPNFPDKLKLIIF